MVDRVLISSRLSGPTPADLRHHTGYTPTYVKPAHHLENLDLLRGGAALSVCLFHFSTNNFLLDSPLQTVFQFGYLGVDAFFVISGFVIPLSLYRDKYEWRQLPRFLLRRFVRLYPAYFASGVLFVFFWFLASRMPLFAGRPPRFTGDEVVGNLTFTADFLGKRWINPVYWTLALEAQFYLLIGVYFPLLNASSPWVRRVSLCVWLIVPLIIHLNAAVFSALALFGGGILLFMKNAQLIDRATFYLLSLVAIFVQLFVSDYKTTIAGVIAFLGIAYSPKVVPQIALKLGVMSYSIYLLHVFTGGRVINLGYRFPESLILRITFVGLAVIVTLVSSSIFYHFVEKPSHLYAKKIGRLG